MEFPTIVYRVPGRHIGNGCTYDYKGADGKAVFDALLADGWFETMLAAKDGKATKISDRKALEAEARALGISFNWKTSDAALADKIAAAQ